MQKVILTQISVGQYDVLSQILHNGTIYKAGDGIDLDPEHAAPLLAVNAIRLRVA